MIDRLSVRFGPAAVLTTLIGLVSIFSVRLPQQAPPESMAQPTQHRNVAFNPAPEDSLAEQGTALVKKYCHQCHGGESRKGDEAFDILDHKVLTNTDTGYVVEGDLESSYVWQRIDEGDMPPEDAEQPSDDEKELIGKWINAGAPIDTTQVSTTVSADDAANDPKHEPMDPEKLAEEGVRILDQYCGKCHPGKGNPDFDPGDRERMVMSTANMIVPGKPEESLVWQQVNSGQMPPRRAIEKNQAVALTPGDKRILQDWLAAGATYPGKKTRGEFFNKAKVWETVYRDLRSLHQSDRSYARYFSLDNVYNNHLRYSDEDLVAHHAAISKVCNSLSHETVITPPVRVDEDGVVWRIDLRDYGWDSLDFSGSGVENFSAWKLLINGYPYGLSYSDVDDQQFRDNYEQVLDMTGSAMPIVRGDWFVFNATQGGLYYLLARIPAHDQQLEKHLGVDVESDFLRQRLLRSGVINSGVSVSNRLMDRHDSRDGYYWKSYDFAIGSKRNDLHTFPLGPSIDNHPFPDTVFHEDGGEMIFSLPNGMQAYMLIDHQGNRIERGPATVVGDGEWTSGTPEVANAISCMNCHAGGMRFYADDVRVNLAVFGEQRRFAEKLFDPENRLQEILERDAAIFRKACNLCYEKVVDNIPEEYFKPGTEPVAVVARLFFKELNAFDVGIEIGLAPPTDNIEQLGILVMGRAQGNVHVQTLGLRPLVNPGGKIRRESFDRIEHVGGQSLFQEVCTEFNIAPGRDASTSDAVKIFEAYQSGRALNGR